MKKAIILIAVTSFLCLMGGAGALADTLTLTGVAGDTAPYGVYVGPYQISVNNGTTTTPLSLICDDYYTDINIGNSWIATATNGSTLVSGGVGGTFLNPTGIGVTGYEEIFYLAAQMEMPGTSAATIAAIHYAIWEISDPNSPPYNTDPSAQGWLQAAEANYTSIIPYLNDFVVYDPQPLTSAQIAAGYIYPSQEFIQVLSVPNIPVPSVPEPSSLVFLGVTLLMIGGAVSLKVRKTRSI